MKNPFFKPIINTLALEPPKRITKKHLTLLKRWAKIKSNMAISVRASVRISINTAVGVELGNKVRDNVWDSVWDTIGTIEWDPLFSDVGNSVWAYVGSFFCYTTRRLEVYRKYQM